MNTDRVRVVRLLSYEGPRKHVEVTVQRSIKGTVIYGDLTIHAVTLHEFPFILSSDLVVMENEELTKTISLMQKYISELEEKLRLVVMP
jgi:hypothetical protein